MELHVYHHLDFGASVTVKLDQLLTLVQNLTVQGGAIMQELDTLKTKVQETTDVEQSAIELINGLAAQLASAKNDPAAIQALADQLSSKSGELAAAVAANTPAA